MFQIQLVFKTTHIFIIIYNEYITYIYVRKITILVLMAFLRVIITKKFIMLCQETFV